MDIQMYLSLKRSIKEKLPIEVYFGGTVATKARVWGAQRLSGFRLVNNCLTLEPIQNAAAIHEARGASPSMRERRNDRTMMHQNGTQLQHKRVVRALRSVFYM
jgi:hypothetical protein